MKIIELSRGEKALVDDEDFARLNDKRWCLAKNGYVVCVKYKGRIDGKTVNESFLMHREVLNAKTGEMVDHIDGNKLDNRKCNLRLVNMEKNQWNSKMRCDNPSGEKGVRLYEKLNKWQARITHHGEQIHLGYFDTKEEAVSARRKAARELRPGFPSW